ncbi:hypothetical protein [Geoalkalibacter halelectricus]|uniref:Uncharacterized protein n=1 Tax=Geoalkalibacter halelectricus TaxID=2847045 RepID=A0ABY5ZT81_9BACT|nr:hypothetical protein [Geoalkalibacter halelectricus]MDO3376891.1 hypothetical protein [Geoalkalibacter halelectricus]UWZ81115.1 hypothetical protein L9S41_06890 [Geoalkalibacter halelectricus]
MNKKDKAKPTKIYTLADHAMNGLIGYLAYALAFIAVVTLARVMIGTEETQEMMPLYVFFYVGASTLVATFILMKKVKHDTGGTKEKTSQLILVSVVSFTVQFVALNILTRVGLLNIEILMYFSLLIMLLGLGASYKFYYDLSPARKKAKHGR